MKSAQEFSMKLSYGLGAIALCGLQVAVVQNIAVAKPISV
jgi:hypothetical protein